MAASPVPRSIDAVAAGEPVVICGGEHAGGGGGHLMVAADLVDQGTISHMLAHTTGLICVAITQERADQLELPLMVAAPLAAPGSEPFTVSVDLRPSHGAGMSSVTRARTVAALADPRRTESDFDRPGHVFPLRAQRGGVLARPHPTEAAVDLARLAGRAPAGAIAALVDDRGALLGPGEVARFAEANGFMAVSIAELVQWRYCHERVVDRFSTARIPTSHGDFTAHAYRSRIDGQEHMALVRGDLDAADPLVRVHSECLTGDVFGSQRCDCGPQLDAALSAIAAAPGGVLVYLRGHEGRGIGLAHKLAAYALQDEGHDTVDANLALGLPVDAREYGIGAQILQDLGVHQVRLLTNNPAKEEQLARLGIDVSERVAISLAPTDENLRYLRTKQERLGHTLGLSR
jgi:3,4-dihydroxy 2-butanone 4-phosphate synthase/GTP cyclohydrolase II